MVDDDDDDNNTMDNPKHIWPSTFTKLYNVSFKVNLRLSMIPYILYCCSIMLGRSQNRTRKKITCTLKKIIKAHTKLYSTLCMSILHDNVLTLYFYT